MYIFIIPESEIKNKNLMKVTGQAQVKKLYDKQLKSYIIEIESNIGSKIQFPKEEKMELGVI